MRFVCTVSVFTLLGCAAEAATPAADAAKGAASPDASAPWPKNAGTGARDSLPTRSDAMPPADAQTDDAGRGPVRTSVDAMSSDDSGSDDAQVACPAQPVELARECATAADCTSARVSACCAPARVIGLRREALAAHAQNERCRTPCGLADCPDVPPVNDDGLPVMSAGVDVVCRSGQCRTQTPDADQFACGTTRCVKRAHYCFSISGGLPSSGTSTSCMSNATGCTDCACLGFSSGGCLCTRTQEGELHVMCFAP